MDWRLCALAALTLSAIAVSGAQCTAEIKRAQADVAIACVNSGGAWVKNWETTYDCKRQGLK